MIHRALCPCWGTRFTTLETFSSSGYHVVLPRIPSFRFLTSLSLQRRSDSAVVCSLLAFDDLGASFSSGCRLFSSVALSKAVG